MLVAAASLDVRAHAAAPPGSSRPRTGTRSTRLSSARFTVVIAAFNAARTIGSSIRSVLRQTEQDFEVIVVDDGSTDETAEAVGTFSGDSRIRLIGQPNRGPAAARNTGLKAARSTYVSMLDADDLWLPDYLEVMGGALDEDPRRGFAYTDAWVLEDETRKVRRRSAMSYQRPPADGAGRENVLSLTARAELRLHIGHGPSLGA